MSPLKFLHIHATSAVVDISPPNKPNGIVSLYRVFTQNKDSYQLVHTVYIFLYIYKQLRMYINRVLTLPYLCV